MSWFTFTILAIFLFTGTNILQRVLAIDTKNPRALSVLFTAYGAILPIIVFMASGKINHLDFPTDSKSWVFMLIACLFWGLFERLRFITAKLLDASILSTIQIVSILVAFIISLFLYQENLTISKFIGLLLIIISILIVSITKQSKISVKGIILTILSSVLLGIAWSLDKIGANYFSTDTYSVFVWTLPILVVYFPYIKGSDLLYEVKQGSWKLVLMSFLTYLGYIAQLKAQVIGEATKVIPLIQLSVITTIIAGVLILNEKSNITKKLLAGIFAVAGAYLLL